jgi:hypothetical protein
LLLHAEDLRHQWDRLKDLRRQYDELVRTLRADQAAAEQAGELVRSFAIEEMLRPRLATTW